MTTVGPVNRTNLRGARSGGGVGYSPCAFTGLANFTRQLNGSSQRDHTYRIIVRSAVEMLGLQGSWLMLVQHNGMLVKAGAFLPDGSEFREDLPGLEEATAQQLYQQVIHQEQALVIAPGSSPHRTAEHPAFHLAGDQALCLVPMKVARDPVGVLVLGARVNGKPNPFTMATFALANAIGQQAAIALYQFQLQCEVERFRGEVVNSLLRVIEARDGEVGQHSTRLVKYSEMLARGLDCSEHEIQQVCWAALLHDIGKIAIPQDILHRRGPLTVEEWDQVRRHPDIGADIIDSVTGLGAVAEIVRAHHENYDGSGYPRQLAGEDIPLGARILAVVDSFIAMTEGRPYLPARSPEEAVVELARCSGSKYDPQVIRKFLTLMCDHLEECCCELHSLLPA